MFYSCFGHYLTSAASSSFIQGQSVWYISTDEELSIIKECKLEGTPVSNLVHGALTEDKVNYMPVYYHMGNRISVQYFNLNIYEGVIVIVPF